MDARSLPGDPHLPWKSVTGWPGLGCRAWVVALQKMVKACTWLPSICEVLYVLYLLPCATVLLQFGWLDL